MKFVIISIFALFSLISCSQYPEISTQPRTDSQIQEAQAKMREFHRIVFLPNQQDKAQKLALDACNLGLGEGCAFSVFGKPIISNINEDSALVKKRFESEQDSIHKQQQKMDQLALTFAMRNCEANIGNECTIIAGIYERGDGVERDTNKAEEFYQKACSLDSVQGCLGKKDKSGLEFSQKILSLLKEECKQGDPFLCYMAGEWAIIHSLRIKKSSINAPLIQEAKQFYSAACKLGFDPELLGMGENCANQNIWNARIKIIQSSNHHKDK
ncbi:hypothetical protein CCZ01_02170 [Helicobacter monodelphidis]|uniref:tetratricopeptide repeat protein n=1 Tax=Helicobacter sp. 15-1451 TaxID=2004995 RepID=UPI000DCB112A|nr:sel1 repeat family protein [Helicobacter sp. 15-1451]RAX58613.1 hypothetical protein CCZ01_02170 [Helicobacter sp. 15-1451]